MLHLSASSLVCPGVCECECVHVYAQRREETRQPVGELENSEREGGRERETLGGKANSIRAERHEDRDCE